MAQAGAVPLARPHPLAPPTGEMEVGEGGDQAGAVLRLSRLSQSEGAALSSGRPQRRREGQGCALLETVVTPRPAPGSSAPPLPAALK